MSLLGLVRHMSEVERHWFRRELAGQDAAKLYCTGEDPDGDWNGAVPDVKVADEAWRSWRAEVAFAEQFVADTADLGPLGTTQVPLRDVLVHMIEEYARHCGPRRSAAGADRRPGGPVARRSADARMGRARSKDGNATFGEAA